MTTTVPWTQTLNPAAMSMTPDGMAVLPPLARVRDMSAVDTVALARRLMEQATDLSWEGTRDIEGVCGLRRQLHSLAALIARRGDDLPPQALIDVDTACRLIERAAILAILEAQDEGRLPPGERTRAAWLGDIAPELARVHDEINRTTFAVAIDTCRERGVVTFSALRQQLDGSAPATPAKPATPVEAPQRSADEVTDHVRTVIQHATDAASSAAKIADRDVTGLEPAVAADLARTLWDRLVLCTSLYTTLSRRGRQRGTLPGS